MRDNRSEGGIAIIAVLWVLTLLSLVAAALSLETRSSLRIARNMADDAAARVAADAGIQRAMVDLDAPSATRRFRADGTVYTWQFANSRVHLSIQDEATKIDLNRAPEARLAALFGSVGVEPGEAQSLAAAIADFRDADDFVRPGGAEEAEYRAAGLAWGPKNAPFQAVEELQQIIGMRPDIYARVASDLTIYSIGAKIDFLNDLGLEIGHFSIRAEANGPNGAVFLREADVQRSRSTPVQILAWR
jgi:general secretion pathway protein K